MMTTTAIPSRFVGCDVGKHHIVVADHATGRITRLENRPDALARFARQPTADCLVVCAATGGHETAPLEALLDAGIPAHWADARKVKAFIQSFGVLGKSDGIDARALACYAAERHRRFARFMHVPADRAGLKSPGAHPTRPRRHPRRLSKPQAIPPQRHRRHRPRRRTLPPLPQTLLPASPKGRKKPRLAQTAVMRKLIIANAKIRNILHPLKPS